MEEIIKQLEEKREELGKEYDEKDKKIASMIYDLEEINVDKPKKAKKKVKKKVMYSDDPKLKPVKKIKVKQPERSAKGRVKFPKKKLFPEEINDFIKRNWKNHPDSELRLMIGEEFDKYYSVDQIKGHRKYLNLVADKPGRKKAKKVIIRSESEEKQLKEDEDSLDDLELD